MIPKIHMIILAFLCTRPTDPHSMALACMKLLRIIENELKLTFKVFRGVTIYILCKSINLGTMHMCGISSHVHGCI